MLKMLSSFCCRSGGAEPLTAMGFAETYENQPQKFHQNVRCRGFYLRKLASLLGWARPDRAGTPRSASAGCGGSASGPPSGAWAQEGPYRGFCAGHKWAGKSAVAPGQETSFRDVKMRERTEYLGENKGANWKKLPKSNFLAVDPSM